MVPPQATSTAAAPTRRRRGSELKAPPEPSPKTRRSPAGDLAASTEDPSTNDGDDPTSQATSAP
eukprot:5306907-Pyramimonas_sp.AAC.1